MYEIFEKLLKEKGITAYRFCKDTGVSSSTISTWKKKDSKCGTELAEIIADYFGVTIDYVLTGKESDKKDPVLTPKDERDISKDLNRIMEKLSSKEDGPASFDGEELDPEAAELFKDELEIALRRLKLINKEKYTPKKYKK